MTIRFFRSPISRTLSLGGLLIVSGCQALEQSGIIPKSSLVDGKEMVRKEQDYRLRFLKEGDPAALRWLLSHRLETGMPLGEVNNVFGQDGVEQADDGWIKKNTSRYRRSDKAYRWGPNSQGESIYLVFRNDQLVNFDPAEFR